MKYLAQAFLLGGLLFFCFSSFVIAATTVSTSNVPTNLDKDGESEIDIQLTCNGCSVDSYLRGVFYPSGTSYFGFTQNKSGTWTNAPGTNCTEYYKIASSDLVEGSWSGKLKIKPDSASAFYTGPGEYLFKVGRYTPSCSSPTWSQEVTVSLTGATPTPTSMPTTTSTPTPVPTAVSSSPTKTPTPTKKSSPTPTPSVPDEGQSGEAPEEAVALVLGESIEASATESAGATNARVLATAAALVAAGLALISGVLIWQKRLAMRPGDGILKP